MTQAPPSRRPRRAAPGAGKRPITFADFAAVRAVSDPQLSPDGRPVLFAGRTTDVEANRYEGVSLFTALHRQNVPGRIVIVPDEGHWIAKPQNQRLWWAEMHGWVAKHLAPGAVQ